MEKKLNVAVLMGGKSPEHEISLISGNEVLKNLDPKKYKATGIVISKDGSRWQTSDKKNFQFSNLNSQFDVAFIAMHGLFGEDGVIQGFLEMMGIPYTGSGVMASALGMDKIQSRKIFAHAGLNVPKYVLVDKGESINLQRIEKELSFPAFVKPKSQGSSVGTSKTKNQAELKKAVTYAHKYDQTAVIEEFLDGIEVTCAVLDNKEPQALPLVEIVPKKEFFDLEAKYNADLTDEICPARIDEKTTLKSQNAALTAYRSVGCRGFSRIDMIIVKNKVYVLEINTIPGLTPVSLFPKAAKAAGISYSELLDILITDALKQTP